MDAESNLVPQRRRISWRLGCSLAFSIFLLIAGFIWWSEGAPERKLEKMLAEDGPKVGATREEVVAWLAQEGIRHERIKSLEGAGDYPAAQSPSRFGGLVPGIQDEFIVGKTYPSDLHCSGGGQVWIYFFFDSDNHLIQHIIKRWYGWL
jgi:hypothetical protein